MFAVLRRGVHQVIQPSMARNTSHLEKMRDLLLNGLDELINTRGSVTQIRNRMTRILQGCARIGERLAEYLLCLRIVLAMYLGRGDLQLHDHPGYSLRQ